MPQGAIKISKSFKGDVKLISLKNQEGHNISLCFLPRSYNLPYHEKTQVKDTQIHHGKTDSNHFICWQGNQNTIVLVSHNNMSHDELVNFAYHLIGEV